VASCEGPQFLLKSAVRFSLRSTEAGEFCMSENKGELASESSLERQRYRLLLEITDVVARAQSVPEAIK
jgi:hypothetical protein